MVVELGSGKVQPAAWRSDAGAGGDNKSQARLRNGAETRPIYKWDPRSRDQIILFVLYFI